MKTAFTDVIKLSARTGRIPEEIPYHYLVHVYAIHRNNKAAPRHYVSTPMVIKLGSPQ